MQLMACPSYRTELSLVGEGGGLVVCTIALPLSEPSVPARRKLAVLSWLAELEIWPILATWPILARGDFLPGGGYLAKGRGLAGGKSCTSWLNLSQVEAQQPGGESTPAGGP